jgi:L-2,4-diaminobutyric acid acetyltransferase
LASSEAETAARNGESGIDAFELRQPTLKDGAALAKLILDCPPLDPNSSYCYLMLCEYFGQTCVLAEKAGVLRGAVTGYVVPQRPNVFFVWQVAVHPESQGLGLGKSMLQFLWDRAASGGATELQTTVSPSNEASLALFKSFAASNGSGFEKSEFIRSSLFEAEEHEDEDLISIKSRSN